MWQIHQLQLHKQHLHLNPLFISMSRLHLMSLKVKWRLKVINQNQNKKNFHLALQRSESHFSLFWNRHSYVLYCYIFFYIIFICSKLWSHLKRVFHSCKHQIIIFTPFSEKYAISFNKVIVLSIFFFFFWKYRLNNMYL